MRRDRVEWCGNHRVNMKQVSREDFIKVCEFLSKEGYLDDDWWSEQPTALERYFGGRSDMTHDEIMHNTETPEMVEEVFPKGKCSERGRALVLHAKMLMWFAGKSTPQKPPMSEEEVEKVIKTTPIGMYHPIGAKGKPKPEPRPLFIHDYKIDLGGVYRLAHAVYQAFALPQEDKK